MRSVRRPLTAAALILLVLAPVAAFAQTDYPTPPTTIGACRAKPCTEAVTEPHVVSSSSSNSLPFTGGNIAFLVTLGLVATVGGIVLVRVGRSAWDVPGASFGPEPALISWRPPSPEPVDRLIRVTRM
jgi:hypothetical protein